MNRSQIENLSLEITEKYLQMLNELSCSKISSPVCTNIDIDNYFYIKVEEISNRWLVDERPVWQIMNSLFVGLHTIMAPISIVFNSDGDRLGVYVGTTGSFVGSLDGMLKGAFPQVKYKQNEDGNLDIFSYSNIATGLNFGGYLKGFPTGNDNYNSVYQIDSIIKGMIGRSWNVSIFATPLSKASTIVRQQYWLGEASKCSQLSEVSYNESDNLETVSYKKSFFHSQQYEEKVEAFNQQIIESIESGEWCVTVNYSSKDNESAKLLGGLLTSAFNGDKSQPESVHTISNDDLPFQLITDGTHLVHNSFENQNYPKYSSLISSGDLAVYAAFPTIDTFGFSVTDYVEFDVNRADGGNLSIGNIVDGGTLTNNEYKIDINEFNRHCLVIGLTGAGKTNTLKSLICDSTREAKIPFMVIEPAKKEYWELYKLGFDDIQIYSVGSSEPNAHTFCLNPFERTVFVDENGNKKTVSIQTHIDFVYSAFKASFIMYTPMPYVLEKAIYSIYEDCGWDIKKNINVTGVEQYPTIEDLYYKIPQVVIDMGYDAKMRNDLIGSLQARINSMRLGSKGDTLNVKQSFPFAQILNSNAVIELEDVGDDDVKAFIISMLLISLLEYRRQQSDSQQEIQHIMLIEEAHRLLKNVQSGTGENADPRGAAVEFFCNLLAELRSKGQGFVVADQIPSKLAPDLIKNTNLKIIHRTVAEEERALVGGAMHMTDVQIDSLASLKQGYAAVYSEGDNRPKLVKSKYAGVYSVPGRENISRDQVLFDTTKNCISAKDEPCYQSLTHDMNAFCKKCDRGCSLNFEDVLKKVDSVDAFKAFAHSIHPNVIKTCKVENIETALDEFCTAHIRNVDIKDAKCMFNCLLEQWNLNPDFKARIINAKFK